MSAEVNLVVLPLDVIRLDGGTQNGLRRTNEDKRRAVEVLIADSEWARNTDRWIAEMAGVSHPFVSSIRSQVVTVTTSQKGGVAEPEVRQGKDGKFYRQRAANREATHGSDAPLDGVEAALQSALAFDACLTRLNDLLRTGEKLAHGPGGGYFGRQLAEYQDHAKRMAQLLSETKPHARCDQCAGAGGLLSSRARTRIPGKPLPKARGQSKAIGRS